MQISREYPRDFFYVQWNLVYYSMLEIFFKKYHKILIAKFFEARKIIQAIIFKKLSIEKNKKESPLYKWIMR